MLLIQALWVAVITFLGKFDFFIGNVMLQRPILLGALVGLAFGNLREGIIIGFAIELAFIGTQMLGTAVPPDFTVGGVLGTAFALKAGDSSSVGLTIAIPVAVLSALLVSFFYAFITPFFDRLCDKYAAEDNSAGITTSFMVAGFLFDITFAVIAGLAYYFGTGTVKEVLAAIPNNLLKGITVATGMLPALGFAQLLQNMVDKKTAVFFFLGFLLAAYLKVPVIGIVAFALVLISLMSFMRNQNSKETMTSSNSSTLENGDDDNEF